MSGLFGVMGRASRDELDEMGRRLRHRGGHARWAEIDNGVYLGSVFGEAPCGGLHDGSVADISAAALGRGSSGGSVASGTLQALDLSGFPFALARWDPSLQRLSLTRDFMGVKPLYYCRLPGGGVAFASEYKAILALGEVPAEPDYSALQHLHIYKATPNDGRTLLNGIRAVPPGVAVHFDRAGRVESVPFAEQLRLQISVVDEAEASNRLRQLLVREMERYLGDRTEVGMALSGGIDSLAVAYLARHVRPNIRLVGFTTGAHERDRDIEVARIAMDRLGGQHVAMPIAPDRLLADLRLTVWHLENPIGRSETYHFFEVGRVAAAHGFEWVLSGMGADGIFAGMPRHKVLWLAEQAGMLRADLLEFFEATQTGRAATRRVARFLSRMYFRGEVPIVPRVRNTASPRLSAPVPPGPEFLNRCLLAAEPEHTAYSLPRIERPLQASGVDYVSPFLSRSVVDFAFSLPGTLKIKHGVEKYILRRAMRGIVPEDLCRVPKGLMRFQSDERFSQVLHELSERYLSADVVARRGLFDAEQVADIRAMCRRKNIHPEAAMRLWTLIVTEIWAEQYLDARGARPPDTALHIAA